MRYFRGNQQTLQISGCSEMENNSTPFSLQSFLKRFYSILVNCFCVSLHISIVSLGRPIVSCHVISIFIQNFLTVLSNYIDRLRHASKKNVIYIHDTSKSYIVYAYETVLGRWRIMCGPFCLVYFCGRCVARIYCGSLTET